MTADMIKATNMAKVADVVDDVAMDNSQDVDVVEGKF